VPFRETQHGEYTIPLQCEIPRFLKLVCHANVCSTCVSVSFNVTYCFRAKTAIGSGRDTTLGRISLINILDQKTKRQSSPQMLCLTLASIQKVFSSSVLIVIPYYFPLLNKYRTPNRGSMPFPYRRHALLE
jgi:hypothetical protein